MLSSSLGIALASAGEEVILVDADFGGANLHTCLGMLEPRFTLFDYYTLQKESLSDILLPTPVKNLRLISGACGALGLVNPTHEQKQLFIQDLKKLHADKILLDLGAGSSIDIIDLFLLADEKILVVTPQPTSLYEAFGFLKVCLLHQLNSALKDFPAVMELFVKEKINHPEKMPLTLAELMSKVAQIDSEASGIFERILHTFRPKLILNMVQHKDDIKEMFEKRRWQKQIRNHSKEYPKPEVLKNAPICSINCFYWDDCEYQEGGLPCRVRHLEPVLRSK